MSQEIASYRCSIFVTDTISIQCPVTKDTKVTTLLGSLNGICPRFIPSTTVLVYVNTELTEVTVETDKDLWDCVTKNISLTAKSIDKPCIDDIYEFLMSFQATADEYDSDKKDDTAISC